MYAVCGFCLLEDGRLCAAAFVQNRKSYTGCTDAPNPAGESGRSWCYVEAQVGACVFPDRLSAGMLFLGGVVERRCGRSSLELLRAGC